MGIGRRALYLLFALFGFVGYGLVQTLFAINKKNVTPTKIILTFVAAGLLIVGLYLFYYSALYRQNNWGFKAVYEINWKDVAIAVIGLAVILGVQILISQMVPIHHQSDNQKILEIISKRASNLFTVMLVVVAPICEELIFRGLFYEIFFITPSTRNIVIGSIVNGIIFALIHGFTLDTYFVMYWFTGVVLSAEYLMTRKISTPMLTHICNNLIALL